jgi:glycosyltransferase involved in cell wall biosynthesis
MSELHLSFCFCIKSFCVLGGAERVLATVASGLSERGHEVTILSFDAPGYVPAYAVASTVRRIGLGIGVPTAHATIAETARRVPALRRAVVDLAPGVAVGFMHSMFVPLSIALLGTRVPVLGSEHIVPEHYKGRPLESALIRLAPYMCDRLVCVSDQALELFPKSIRHRMSVIENPVMAPGGRADVAPEAGRKVLLSVGRLDPQKDHATLLEAFALVADRVPDWDLRIVGEGALRASLEAKIRALGLGGRVTLPGATRDISEEYCAAHLYVSPSRYESLGLTTVEAMMHGLPAVGFSDCAGTNRLIGHGVNGILVDGSRDRAQSLASGLLELMRDSGRRAAFAQNALDVGRAFDTRAILDAWEQAACGVARLRSERAVHRPG